MIFFVPKLKLNNLVFLKLSELEEGLKDLILTGILDLSANPL